MSLKALKLPKNEDERLAKLVVIENEVRAKGYHYIVGVDEAGRGPLAGPVVAAACLIPKGIYFPGINDSKLLLPTKRKAIYSQLISHPHVQLGLGIVATEVIDKINILQATFQAMREAVYHLPTQPDYILVDGNHAFLDTILSQPIVKGDRQCQMIAAASIIAKETRDQIMLDWHEKYPEYSFNEHKGYGTEKHRMALIKYGPCPIHRRSFISKIVRGCS